MKNQRRTMGVVILFVCAFVAAAGWELNSEREAEYFFRAQLHTLGITTATPGFQSAQMAYAQQLAIRNPLLGIAGVDHALLRENTQKLKDTLDSLAAIQTTAQDKRLLASLYPISFLHSLALAEEARVAFVSSGTLADYRQYDRALNQAIRDSNHDAHNFLDALTTYLQKAGALTIASAGGVQTSESLVAAAEAAVARTEEVASALAARRACINGALAHCTTISFSAPLPPHTAGQAADFSLAESLWRLRQQKLLTATDSMPLWQSSVCLGKPQYFLASDNSPRLIYLSDMFFNSTLGSDGPMYVYLRNTFAIEYSYVNPMQFYQCPEILSDIALAAAIRKTYAFAHKYPNLAQPALSQTPPMTEGDALTYLHAVAERVPSDASAAEFIELKRMWHERSAGLDVLVGEIASTTQADLLLHEGGAPHDLSARKLFLTNSAFPSLFLLQNPSAGGGDPVVRTTKLHTDSSIFLSSITNYATANDATRNRMLEDFRKFLNFERVL